MHTSRRAAKGALAVSVGLALLVSVAPAAADQVRTDAGLVEGFTPPGSSVRVFRGIPYAAPPVGERRWRPPAPVAPWEGVRPATAFGPRCMQQRVSRFLEMTLALLDIAIFDLCPVYMAKNLVSSSLKKRISL